MRVQCDVCEKQLARVLCCADEAALCEECDAAVHAANKLANKHQRVSILQDEAHLALERPICDICQEKVSFFFCMEDRAVLCRDCDVAIHLPDTLSASHRRFLFTNTRVSLEALVDPVPQPAGAGPALLETPTAQNGNGKEAAGSSQRRPLPAAQTAAGRQGQKVAGIRGLGGAGAASSAAALGEGSSRTLGTGNMKSKASITSGSKGQGLWNGGASSSALGGLSSSSGARGLGLTDSFGGFGDDDSLLEPHGALQGSGGSLGTDALGAHTLAFARASLSGGMGPGQNRGRHDNPFDVDNVPSWRVDELLNIPDLADGYSLADVGSSKAEMGNLGDFDWTADLSLFDEQVYAESLHEVPQLSSPVQGLPGPGSGSLSPFGLSGGSSLLGGSGGGLGGGQGPRGATGTGVLGARARATAAVPDVDDCFVVPDVAAAAPVNKRRRAVT